MDCRVVVEAAVPVYDVETADEAVRIAISKTGEMLNPDLNYVEINMGSRECPHCNEPQEPAFIAADEALVALELEMTVFNVEHDEHASRIARKEIGQRLRNIPLEVIEIAVIEEDDEEDEPSDGADDADDGDDTATDEGDADDGMDDGPTADEADTGDETSEDEPARENSTGGREDGTENGPGSRDGTPGEDEDILPEFEDLLDE